MTQSMTRVLMAALLLAIPLLTSWILARRVAAPRQIETLTRAATPRDAAQTRAQSLAGRY